MYFIIKYGVKNLSNIPKICQFFRKIWNKCHEFLAAVACMCYTPKNGRSWFYSTLTRLITLSCLFRLCSESFKKRQNWHRSMFWNVLLMTWTSEFHWRENSNCSYINKVGYILLRTSWRLNTNYFAKKI